MPKLRNSDMQAAVDTRSYVRMRLSELADTVKAHIGERSALTKEIQALPKDGSPKVQKLRDRRNYLVKRLEILRQEQEELWDKKKEINQTIAQMGRGKAHAAEGVGAHA